MDLLGPQYVYMPDLPTWLHWAIYVALGLMVLVVAGAASSRLHGYQMSMREVANQLTSAFFRHPRELIGTVASEALLQRRVVRDRSVAIIHLTIFLSYLVLTMGTVLIALQHDLTQRFWGYRFLVGPFYLGEKTLLDTAALGLIVGVCLAARRRFKVRPIYLGARPTVVVAYASLLVMALSGLALEALRELAIPISWAWWTYAGHTIALALRPLVGTRNVLAYQAMWFVHVVSAFVFMASAVLTALDHVLFLPVSVALQSNRKSGAFLSMPFVLSEVLENDGDIAELSSGMASVSSMPTSAKFMVMSCLNCGRCDRVCPALRSGRDLSPRSIVQALRGELGNRGQDAESGDFFERGIIAETSAWSCLTCGACMRECPAWINQPGLIMDLRRQLADTAKNTELQGAMLTSLERYENPFGLPAFQRGSWASEMGVPTVADKPSFEYLYWVGCMASFDARAKKIAQSVVAILREAEIDFAVLGDQEKCLGEAQRKIGDELGFQLRAIEVIDLLKSHQVSKIITHCPHCFTTFANDYRQLGASFEVIHHSELIAKLVQTGRIKVAPGAADKVVAYHDPCNLGRLNGIVDAPRTVVRSVAGDSMVEFEQSRERSFCCGAGGANYFYKVPQTRAVSALRIEQAQAVGADVVATACPFCMGMLIDAEQRSESGSKPIAVSDIAELVAQNLLPAGSSSTENA